MVARFNGRISEVLHQTRFASAAQLKATLMNYVKTYNHQIPQRALNHISLDLNAAIGGKGVRFSVSNSAAPQHFSGLFQKNFPGQIGDNSLSVWHVPGEGM